jgi:hypothetical protein
MKKFLNQLRTQLSLLLNPVPEVQSEYVDKVVYLLRRDFDSKEQNEILVAVVTKLAKLRDEDLAQMEKDYANLQESNNILKHRIALN